MYFRLRLHVARGGAARFCFLRVSVGSRSKHRLVTCLFFLRLRFLTRGDAARFRLMRMRAARHRLRSTDQLQLFFGHRKCAMAAIYQFL